jgi:hypothetical protein
MAPAINGAGTPSCRPGAASSTLNGLRAGRLHSLLRASRLQSVWHRAAERAIHLKLRLELQAQIRRPVGFVTDAGPVKIKLTLDGVAAAEVNRNIVAG